jgi:hypothetical protein
MPEAEVIRPGRSFFAPSTSAAPRTQMLREHLLERFPEVRICLFLRTVNPASVNLPAPMPSDPLVIESAVHRRKDWTVFSDVDGSVPPFIVQYHNGIRHRQHVLAPFAEAQVVFDIFQTCC